MAMKQRMKGGPRNRITSLQVAVKASERMWFTPSASLGHDDFTLSPEAAEKRIAHGPGNLAEQVQEGMFLPTPRHEGHDAGAHRGNPDSLHSFAKMFPTPRTVDHRNDAGPSEMARNTPGLAAVAQMFPMPQEGMKLNPDWVSRMMGFPDGWLTLDGEATP